MSSKPKGINVKLRKSLSALTVSAAIFLAPTVILSASVVALSPTSAVASDWCGPNSDEGTCGGRNDDGSGGRSVWDLVVCSLDFWFGSGSLSCN
jgi:hypothetical protein